MSYRPMIVVIDDDRSVCKSLRRLLRTAQMNVETYPSAETFLTVSAPREPDCLVLDIRMPGMSGPALRDHLVDAGRRIPVVFMTAHAEEVPRQRGPVDGWAEVLHKPFDEQVLLQAIQRAMDRTYGHN